jgi:hypothetical protein
LIYSYTVADWFSIGIIPRDYGSVNLFINQIKFAEGKSPLNQFVVETYGIESAVHFSASQQIIAATISHPIGVNRGNKKLQMSTQSEAYHAWITRQLLREIPHAEIISSEEITVTPATWFEVSIYPADLPPTEKLPSAQVQASKSILLTDVLSLGQFTNAQWSGYPIVEPINQALAVSIMSPAFGGLLIPHIRHEQTAKYLSSISANTFSHTDQNMIYADLSNVLILLYRALPGPKFGEILSAETLSFQTDDWRLIGTGH